MFENTIRTSWLEDQEKAKFAPKTLVETIQDSNGVSLAARLASAGMTAGVDGERLVFSGKGGSLAGAVVDTYALSEYASSLWTNKINLKMNKCGRIVTVHLHGKISMTGGQDNILLDNLPLELKALNIQDFSIVNYANYVSRAWIENNTIYGYSRQTLSNVEVNIHGTYMTDEFVEPTTPSVDNSNEGETTNGE